MMAERVVDPFEMVEVEIKHRKPLAAKRYRGQCFAPAVRAAAAVGKVGKGVMTRHMGDLLFRASALGDVFVG